MIRPTARGVGLVLSAAATYLAARILGTWELYLIALAFAAMVALALALVAAGSRGLRVERRLRPARPAAGDRLEFSFRVGTGRRLPGLLVTLEDAAGRLSPQPVHLVVDGFGATAETRAIAGPWPARRGVHRLPPFPAVIEDPLGLVRGRRTVGEELHVTVVPRLVELPSCAVCEDVGRRHGGGRRRLPTRDAWEFRGIRPLTPGEPLNRVDWKSTAKTGNLMLREMEAATEEDLTLLLCGAAAHDAGDPPDSSFEAAVRAAGSIAAFTLRTGHAVTLLLPDHGWRPVELAADAASRRRLLGVLAQVEPTGPARLGPSLDAIVGSRSGRRPPVLVVVVLGVDDGLVRALLGLRRQGVAVSLVHVRDGADGRGPDAGASRALAAAGVRYVPLGRHDDLPAALAAHPAAALARAR